ncbi:MAG: hypothetical protein AAF495_10750 [Pseudomonadota bacterium]
MPKSKPALWQVLARQRFRHADLAKSAVTTGGQLNNITNKSQLLLVSESAGQGRARAYCLIDAYQVSIYATLSRLTGNAQWSARLCNQMLFANWVNQQAGDAAPLLLSPPQDLRDKLCSDLKHAPAWYTERDKKHPVCIFADDTQVGGSNPPLPRPLAMVDLHGQALLGGVIVNLTANFQRVDTLLKDHLERSGVDLGL